MKRAHAPCGSLRPNHAFNRNVIRTETKTLGRFASRLLQLFDVHRAGSLLPAFVTTQLLPGIELKLADMFKK